jgi:hypothetical protein
MTSTAPAKTVKTAAAATTRWEAYAALAELLTWEVVNAADPPPERASNILLALGGEWARLLEVTGIGRALTKAIRSCKQHSRASDKREGWEVAANSRGERCRP